jgi:hypothetical protein
VTVEQEVETYLPWVAHLLHLLPWDIEQLTWSEWRAYRTWVDGRLKGVDGGDH